MSAIPLQPRPHCRPLCAQHPKPLIERLAYRGARMLRRTARALEELVSSQSVLIQRTMARHDMVADPDERYYFAQYWHWLHAECERRFPDRGGCILDVGCGQGRLALPLAAWFTHGHVVGVDLSGDAITQARRYANQQGVTNIEFHAADALGVVSNMPPLSVDVALMTEVTFFMPSYKQVIAAIARVLKPGGMFFISFRSQYFDLLCSVRSRDWQSAVLVREAREGHWGAGAHWFSWHTAADIRALLHDAGFTSIKLLGIGIASGIEGDPLAHIAQPSKLSPGDLAQLMAAETSLAEQYAECGRYILAIAQR